MADFQLKLDKTFAMEVRWVAFSEERLKMEVFVLSDRFSVIYPNHPVEVWHVDYNFIFNIRKGSDEMD